MPTETDAPHPTQLSVIIPTYNRYAQLVRTVELLVAQVCKSDLADTVEVVVVDDGSVPSIAARVRAFVAQCPPFVRCVALPRNAGPAAARNAGAQASRGALLAFLDDDISPADDYISSIIASHREHPDALVINGNLRATDDDVYSGFWFHYYNAVFNRPGQDFYPVSMLAAGHFSLKRALLDQVSPLFDTSLTAREDYDLYLRLEKKAIAALKDDHIIGFIQCRNTLYGFIKQRLWYGRGQEQLVAKYGAPFLADRQKRSQVPPNPRYVHLYLALRVARTLHRVYRGGRRLLTPGAKQLQQNDGGPTATRAPDDADMTLPTISIIVLTYNRSKMLADCLRSLLTQQYPRHKLEIIVSDDGSSDGTSRLVQDLQRAHANLKYVYQPHKGISAARNNGIRHAGGDIIAIVADDYILHPTYAPTIADFFRERPEAEVVRFKVVAAGNDLGSRISHFYFDVSVMRRLGQPVDVPARDWRERVARAWRKRPPVEETITTHHNLEAAGAAAFRRDVFVRVGLFDESLQRAEDTDMTRRLRELGIAVYYNPLQHIRHQYSPFMTDTIYKCFLTGYNRYQLYERNGLTARSGLNLARSLMAQKAATLLDAAWRARQAPSLWKTLVILPFMLLFEAANKLGFLCGFLKSRWHTPRPALTAAAREETPT